jgi:hypothetical protein
MNYLKIKDTILKYIKITFTYTILVVGIVLIYIASVMNEITQKKLENHKKFTDSLISNTRHNFGLSKQYDTDPDTTLNFDFSEDISTLTTPISYSEKEFNRSQNTRSVKPNDFTKYNFFMTDKEMILFCKYVKSQSRLDLNSKISSLDNLLVLQVMFNRLIKNGCT